MKLHSADAYFKVRVKYLFKDLNRGSKTGFSNIPAPFPVMLDAFYFIKNLFPYKLPAFFFGLLSVQAKSIDNSNILVCCSPKVKFFEQRRKDFFSRSWPGHITYNNCNL